MLILTRKKEESLVINENIEIHVISIDDGKVKLGIKAPRDIEIHRKEVYDRIHDENKKSIAAKEKLTGLKDFLKND